MDQSIFASYGMHAMICYGSGTQDEDVKKNHWYPAILTWCLVNNAIILYKLHNRPFYRYGGHIELIQFKEYYRMPRGHEHISFVFSSAFWDIFS